MDHPEKIPLQELIAAILDDESRLDPRFVFRLSGLTEEEFTEIKAVWPQVSVERRQSIFTDIEELANSDLLLEFEPLCIFALQDEAASVRQLAIQTLWDYEEPKLIPAYLKMLAEDEDQDVRSSAASILGRYIYMGELEELPPETLHTIEETLLETLKGEDEEIVRCRALEALGFSSRKEVAPSIETAYYSGDNRWLKSALFARGRSADKRWGKLILSMLEHDEEEIQLEAIRAAGELEFEDAVPQLLDMLDSLGDEQLMAAIWSLSQLGGEGVSEAFEYLQTRSEDDEVIELLEQAMDNLSHTEDLQLFDLSELDDWDDDLDEEE